jgi:hypothetical protein
MTEDIGHILKHWKFNPDAPVRKIVGDDGREKLQVRVSQGPWNGILQMEMDGRPDGKRPHGFDYALEYQKGRLGKYREENQTDAGFRLDRKDCAELFEESLAVYGRYVILLGLEDFERVVSDTERNMEVFRLVNRYAADEDDRMNLEKWWPYILRIHGTARSMIAMKERDFDRALGIVRETRGRIEDLNEIDAEEFRVERQRAREQLLEMEDSILKMQGKTDVETLKQQLEKAVADEQFEEAAKLRDRIREMRKE